MYQKIRYLELTVEPELSLRIETKSMNYKMNLEDLVPSLPGFDTIPNFPAINSELPNQAERIRDLQMAGAEKETVTSELRV